MSLTGNSRPIVTRGSRISRAPPHLTLPDFLNLDGRKNDVVNYRKLSLRPSASDVHMPNFS